MVVDLTKLSFADSSLMVDLAMLARRLRTRGRGIALHGAQPQIQMLIELSGLHAIDGVRLEPHASGAT